MSVADLDEYRAHYASVSDEQLWKYNCSFASCHWCPCPDYYAHDPKIRCMPAELVRQEMKKRGLK